MGNNYHYSTEEEKFIKENWKTSTDIEIGKVLNKKPDSIKRKRKAMGLIKRSGRPSIKEVKQAKIEMAETTPSQLSLASLDKQERLEIYKKNFNKNPRYASLLQELHSGELELYKHKYIEFMDSIDTITNIEEDALHHMIMADITISRVRRMIKQMEEEKENENQPLVYGLYETLEKAEKKWQDYQKLLKVTREARLKEHKEEKENFSTIVNAYRNKTIKQEMGDKAALMDYYKSRCQEDMKTRKYLLGD